MTITLSRRCFAPSDEQEPAVAVKIGMEEILAELARETGITVRELRGKGRGRAESRRRAEAAYVGREVGGISLTEAAEYLGRDLSTMSLALKRLGGGACKGQRAADADGAAVYPTSPGTET